MAKKIIVYLLVHIIVFYSLLGSLTNASANDVGEIASVDNNWGDADLIPAGEEMTRIPAGQWSMFKNTRNRAGRTILLGPKTKNLIWNIGSIAIYSIPAIGLDGTIYTGSNNGNFYAFAPDSHEKWRYETGSAITASPAITENRTIYIPSQDGMVYAFRPDGTVKWTYDTNAYAGSYSSPAIGSDGTVYVGVGDSISPETDGLYALNPDGTLKWHYDTGAPIDGPPAIGKDGTIYFPSNGGRNMYALQPDGLLKWIFDCQLSYGFGSAPAIGPDGTIYANTQSHILLAINPDGTLKWKYKFQWAFGITYWPSSPAIGFDGVIYVGMGVFDEGDPTGAVIALNSDGTLKWRHFHGVEYSAPSVGGDGTIYITDTTWGSVYAFNPDGTIKWSRTIPAYALTAPIIGWHHRLYVGGVSGLSAIGP